MRILIDTSILIRTSHPDSVHFEGTVEAVSRLLDSNIESCVVPQVFYEYWVVATRPIPQNGLGFSSAKAEEDLNELAGLFTLLGEIDRVFATWRTLVSQYQVLGKSAHDARLVAAMHCYGIERVLTLNPRDFQRYTGLHVYTPETLPEVLGGNF